MAGDWIKVEHATVDKPEVLRLAELLGVERRYAIGLLLDFWVWLDRNSRHGDVTHMSRMSVDSVTHTPGFSAALAAVGWVEIDDVTGRLTVPHFDRHNGKSAKNRALASDRQTNRRNVDVAKMSRNERDKSVTREEKRRELHPPNPPVRSNGVVDDAVQQYPPSFERFWRAYPKKVGKGDAIRAWQRAKVGDGADLMTALSWQTRSEQWTREGGRYVPNPATYINQRRWEDQPPNGRGKSHDGGSDQVAL